ncbi:unnamed protein product [Citrullus colocynthis]|uniref:Lipocalin/cytosolic fatty-acid binding domain-containing protein n=1 Tax=Citrullus colocynthis TaxID=252529 RepID=A0ABP0ZAC3_9ROSI
MGNKEMEVVKELDLKKATYTLNEDETVKVVNETWSDGKKSSIEGVAYKAEPSSQEAKFKVKFYVPPFLPIIPVIGNYWVLYIDQDYHYVLVGEPSMRYLGAPHVDEEIYKELVEKAKEKNYNVSKPHKTPQNDDLLEDDSPKDIKDIWWIKSILRR